MDSSTLDQSLQLPPTQSPNHNSPSTDRPTTSQPDSTFTTAPTKRVRNEAQRNRRLLKKQRVKAIAHVAKNKGFKQDYYLIMGKHCVPSVELKAGDKFTIRPRELQQSLLYTLNQSCDKPDWFDLVHRPLVDQVVVLAIDGLSRTLIDDHANILTFFHKHFKAPFIPFQCLSSPHITISGAQNILQCAVSKISGYKPQLRVGRLLVSTLDSLFQSHNVAPEFTLIEGESSTPSNQDDSTTTTTTTTTTFIPPPKAPEIDRRKFDQSFPLCFEHFLKHIRYQDLINFSANTEDLALSLFPLDITEPGYKQTLPLNQANELRNQLFDRFPQLFIRPAVDEQASKTIHQTETSTDLTAAQTITDIPPITTDNLEQPTTADPTTTTTTMTDTDDKSEKPIKSVVSRSNLFASFGDLENEEYSGGADKEAVFRQSDYWYSLPLAQYPHTQFSHPVSKFHSFTLGHHACFGLDCEMVRGENDVIMLARLSIVDVRGNPLVDTLVRPTGPVTNYLTQWSGIKPEDYDESSGKTIITFNDAQEIVLAFLSSDHFLLGHGLENDLKALKIVHHRILDTALLYPNSRSDRRIKNSLKFLAKRFLQASIQQSTSDGHDSIEDADYAVRLVIKKLVMGPAYGINNILSFMEVLDFFKIPATLITSAELCRRSSATSTDCVASNPDMTGSVLKYAASRLKSVQAKIDNQLLQIDDTPLLHQSNMTTSTQTLSDQVHAPLTMESMKAEQDRSHLQAIETANQTNLPKHFLFAHSSTLLTVSDKVLEEQLQHHYCLPISNELKAIQAEHASEQKQQQEQQEEQNKPTNEPQTEMNDGVEKSTETITTSPDAPPQPTAAQAQDKNESNSNEAVPSQTTPPTWTIPPIKLNSKYRSIEFMLNTQPSLTINNLEVALATLNQELLTFWENLPPNTLLYIVSGQSQTAFPRFLSKMARDICSPGLTEHLLATSQTPLGLEHQAAFTPQVPLLPTTPPTPRYTPQQCTLQEKFKDFSNELETLSKHILKSNRNGIIGVHIKPTPDAILAQQRELLKQQQEDETTQYDGYSSDNGSSSDDSSSSETD